VPGIDLKPAGRPPAFDVAYSEGLRVGYKWFEAEHKEPLFPFGYGLSYTTYAYSALKADAHSATFTVKNTGKRAGTEVAQVYAMLPSAAGEPFRRLVAWQRVTLKPGEAKTVTLAMDPLCLSTFNEQKDGWQLAAGDYKAFVGPLTAAFHID
jgi:beta-glucosidase